MIRLQAQFDHFTGTLHQRIKILSLRMTAGQTVDRGDIIAFFVPFDHDSELALTRGGMTPEETSSRTSCSSCGVRLMFIIIGGILGHSWRFLR